MKKEFDKYFYYRNSVQSPEADVEFFVKAYKSISKQSPISFREDFCGCFNICTAWIKHNKKHKAIGVDISSEPLNYGKKQHFPNLKDEEIKRLQVIQSTILDPKLPSADIISASNFSYYTLKERKQLLNYFKMARSKLKPKGIFFIDAFGGSDCLGPIEENTKQKGFTYYWDQEGFDPINNHAIFHIHFKVGKERKRKKVFSYDWRLWTLPEIRDILRDAGFSKTYVYWEGSDSKGNGNGEYKKAKVGEACDSWVAYLISVK